MLRLPVIYARQFGGPTSTTFCKKIEGHMTLQDLIAWMESMIGTTIRGRVVNDVDVSISGDGSFKFTACLDSLKHLPTDRLVANLLDSDEIVAHGADINTFVPEELRWEYWDEFADRQIAEDKNR
jgi:hypothetical protein